MDCWSCTGCPGLAVLERHDRQVSALIAGGGRRIHDLANWPYGIDDLRAGRIGHELSDRLDRPGPVGIRGEREHVALGRLEAYDRGLQHLRQPLVEQRNRRGIVTARPGQREVQSRASETERLQAFDPGGPPPPRLPGHRPAPARLGRSGSSRRRGWSPASRLCSVSPGVLCYCGCQPQKERARSPGSLQVIWS